jgi:RNA polymerase sigma factor (sigma-70 family)
MAGVLAEMESCIPALRRYARSLLRNHEEVDDLVHDCLVCALDRLHTRRENGELRAWLFAILHNLFISGARRNGRRPRPVSVDDIDENRLGIGAHQDDHVQTRDLMRLVDELPEEQRSVLLLVCVEDLSYAQVAGVLGIPIGTVMSRLSRARERLRKSVHGETYPALRRVK